MIDIPNLTALLAIAVLFILACITRKSPALPLPPGPKPIPLLGNALDIPKTMDAHSFQRLIKKYGESF